MTSADFNTLKIQNMGTLPGAKNAATIDDILAARNFFTRVKLYFVDKKGWLSDKNADKLIKLNNYKTLEDIHNTAVAVLGSHSLSKSMQKRVANLDNRINFRIHPLGRGRELSLVQIMEYAYGEDSKSTQQMRNYFVKYLSLLNENKIKAPAAFKDNAEVLNLFSNNDGSPNPNFIKNLEKLSPDRAEALKTSFLDYCERHEFNLKYGPKAPGLTAAMKATVAFDAILYGLGKFEWYARRM